MNQTKRMFISVFVHTHSLARGLCIWPQLLTPWYCTLGLVLGFKVVLTAVLYSAQLILMKWESFAFSHIILAEHLWHWWCNFNRHYCFGELHENVSFNENWMNDRNTFWVKGALLFTAKCKLVPLNHTLTLTLFRLLLYSTLLRKSAKCWTMLLFFTLLAWTSSLSGIN